MIRCTSDIECSANGHSIDCPKVPDIERAERYKGLYNGALASLHRQSKVFTRYREQITFWQGKFNMVAHENNKLRRQTTVKNEKGRSR